MEANYAGASFLTTDRLGTLQFGSPRVNLVADATLTHGLATFAFDDEGGIWIASLVSNRLLRVHDGTIETVLEDANLEYMSAVERAFAAGEMGRDHLGPISGTTLQQLTSVAFGGPDGHTVFLGTLHGRCVYRFRANVRGARHSSVGEPDRIT